MRNMVKANIRRLVLDKRNQMSQEDIVSKSAVIIDKVCSLDAYVNADTLLCFLNYGSEVVTDDLIQHALLNGKRVYVPLVTDAKSGSMEFCAITSPDDIAVGYKGIREPIEHDYLVPKAEDKVLMILPGCAFDFNGNRIGYGKGFYDRYLQRYYNMCRMKTIAIAFHIQIVENIEPGKHDVPYDVLITENTVFQRVSNPEL